MKKHNARYDYCCGCNRGITVAGKRLVFIERLRRMRGLFDYDLLCAVCGGAISDTTLRIEKGFGQQAFSGVRK